MADMAGADEDKVTLKDFFQVKEDTAVIRHDLRSFMTTMSGQMNLLTEAVRDIAEIKTKQAVMEGDLAGQREDINGLHQGRREDHQAIEGLKIQIAKWAGGLAVISFAVGAFVKYG